MIMAGLLNTSSPLPSPSLEHARKFHRLNSRIPKFVIFSKLEHSSNVSVAISNEIQIPISSRKDSKTDPRSISDKLNTAFSYLEEILEKGQQPDSSHTFKLIHALCKANELRKAIKVVGLMNSSGCVPDLDSYSLLVKHLCRKGYFGYALQLVDEMRVYSLNASNVPYNVLIKGLCGQKRVDKCLQFVYNLLDEKLSPNTYTVLLETVCKDRGVDEAMRLANVILDNGGRISLVNYNVLLTGLCKEGRTDEAVQFFKDLHLKGHKPNVVTYNILLRSLCTDRRWDEAYSYLADMASKGKVPTYCTYSILIGCLADQGKLGHARKLLDGMFEGPVKPGTAIYSPIIANLCREKNVDEVMKILDQINQHKIKINEAIYNSIAVLCEVGLVTEAFSIFKQLSEGLTAHDFYKNVISALCLKGNTYSAFQLLYEMTKSGFTPDSSACSSLIVGLCYEGMFEVAMEIFIMAMEEERKFRPNVETFNQVLRALCKCKRTDLSLEVFKMKIEDGCMPNETTYAILIEGIVQENEKDLAYDVLKELHLRGAISEISMDKLVLQYELEEIITHRKISKLDQVKLD